MRKRVISVFAEKQLHNKNKLRMSKYKPYKKTKII